MDPVKKMERRLRSTTPEKVGSGNCIQLLVDTNSCHIHILFMFSLQFILLN